MSKFILSWFGFLCKMICVLILFSATVLCATKGDINSTLIYGAFTILYFLIALGWLGWVKKAINSSVVKGKYGFRKI